MAITVHLFSFSHSYIRETNEQKKLTNKQDKINKQAHE